ncbi:MAG: IS3 family transposase, partial [Candidatus Bathyarchaeota archaeon]|nr:IS3 family transposase [Candidatus Bathyarchaeota archaeon]
MPVVSKYEFIEQQETHAKAKWAQQLGVSRSGYYTWLNEREKRSDKYNQIREKVEDIFHNEGKGTYGAERICGCMRRDGMKASFGVVKRIMDQQGLKSCHIRRRQRSLTDSRKSRGAGYENLTRDIQIDQPFQVLSSDLSYIRTGEGFDYVCQVRDVFTNAILASTQSNRMKATLVSRTVEKVCERWDIPKGAIFHSDRGSQYTAQEVKDLIAGYGWRQSFSRVGKPGDNAWSESFFSIL